MQLSLCTFTARLVKLILGAIGGSQRLSLQSYAVVGAAACLGGATRMTISICVLVMETTGSLQLIVPIMVTVVIAKAVGDNFGLGIYDTHIQIRGAPLLVSACHRTQRQSFMLCMVL